jgi:ABC-type transporter Mla MlaB component
MLKIQRTAKGEVVFALSGRLEADSLGELSAVLALEPSGRAATLDLQDLVLVDSNSVDFLRACEGKGIVLRHCPNYIRVWMERDGGRS